MEYHSIEKERNSNSRISCLLHINKDVLKRWWTRYQNTGTVDELPKSGSPEKFSARDRRSIILDSERNPQKPAIKISNITILLILIIFMALLQRRF